ncbi:hypothetical protein [Nonomuraea sp. bgisy101]|uniref:hypothetical protein n=1 Tax=Nonomuraea sp. bgisy101 TaxID=3413784 RepID=UPI003D739808
MRKHLAFAGFATALLMLAPPAVASADKPEPRVSGSMSGTLPKEFGPWAGEPVKFTINAHGRPAGVKGTFKVFHDRIDGSKPVGDFEGKITCLAVAGEVAVATGVITKGYVNILDKPTEDVTGKKVSFTVHDNGRDDRIFWIWEFMGAPVNDCQGTAPAFKPARGDFTIRG